MKVMVQFTLLESQVCRAWFSKRDWDWTGCGDRSMAEWSAEVESSYTMIWEMYGSIIAHQMPVEMADSSASKTMALHIKWALNTLVSGSKSVCLITFFRITTVLIEFHRSFPAIFFCPCFDVGLSSHELSLTVSYV